MHKDGKWAKQIIEWQKEDGSWGDFHSLSVSGGSHITTEQAMHRLERLGYTIEDECIQKAVLYMNNCLVGKNTIPDRAERFHDWNIFTMLILSTGIRRFAKEVGTANKVAKNWAEVISAAFEDGTYNYDKYVKAYKSVLRPSGGKILGIESYYPISLLADCLDEKTELAYVEHILNFDRGICYVYDGKIRILPQEFQSKNASRYLGAVELLVRYSRASYKLRFVADWLNENRGENGKWYMGRTVNDKLYFPLSDNWRKKEALKEDCTERIEKISSYIL